ncbi:Myb-like DNA-binding domain containing protein [Trichomonas vaginalis G3]|uniref:Myb-like DNA-binding domain containing protein n=1 Tax=Trichomonas vaginalis (strain ATCC PRA-98 / G3) TaxID=412133 RepID=A2F098_TRIV3|nr:positive regulation of histone acetylation [Trichomonas vaginalis G3]EAY01660.1 Myb-like DNA-binding domain containing protein [Trichomonas vaginalis G3]KAI5515710.1 positive regulation of histone acetylation [Trichomonas vaginalis G3]|eukprot:XP_001314253.1 Myb-like DNA-binding domain containing protein [Trichomonas vaginalis G3]
MECFGIGSESQNHLRTHTFIVVEPCLPPIYAEDWTGEEESLFFNALQKCGFGNWQDVSNLLKTKSAEQCKAHYLQIFIDNENAPMPPKEIQPKAEIPPPPDFCTDPQDSLPSIAAERNLAEHNKRERTTPAEFAGWMPNRNEFEIEFQTDAEQGIYGITFSADENNEAAFMEKLNALRTYSDIVEAREERIKFALDYNLLNDEFKGFGPQTKENRAFEEQLLCLAQVIPKDELKEFAISLEKEIALKRNLNMLHTWWENGVVSREEGLMFNALEQLNKDDKLTPSAIEKWNREAAQKVESQEYKSSHDKQLLSPAENALCLNFGLSSIEFLKQKDLLIREFIFRGKMTAEIAVSFAPKQARAMKEIFRLMKSQGLFVKDISELDNQDETTNNEPEEQEEQPKSPVRNEEQNEEEEANHSVAEEENQVSEDVQSTENQETNNEEEQTEENTDSS